MAKRTLWRTNTDQEDRELQDLLDEISYQTLKKLSNSLAFDELFMSSCLQAVANIQKQAKRIVSTTRFHCLPRQNKFSLVYCD